MSLGITYTGALFFLLAIKVGSYDDMYTEKSNWTATGAGFVDWGIQWRQKSEPSSKNDTKSLVSPILLPYHGSYARVM